MERLIENSIVVAEDFFNKVISEDFLSYLIENNLIDEDTFIAVYKHLENGGELTEGVVDSLKKAGKNALGTALVLGGLYSGAGVVKDATIDSVNKINNYNNRHTVLQQNINDINSEHDEILNNLKQQKKDEPTPNKNVMDIINNLEISKKNVDDNNKEIENTNKKKEEKEKKLNDIENQSGFLNKGINTAKGILGINKYKEGSPEDTIQRSIDDDNKKIEKLKKNNTEEELKQIELKGNGDYIKHKDESDKVKRHNQNINDQIDQLKKLKNEAIQKAQEIHDNTPEPTIGDKFSNTMHNVATGYQNLIKGAGSVVKNKLSHYLK